MSFRGRLIDTGAIYRPTFGRRTDGSQAPDYGTDPVTGLESVPCYLEILTAAQIRQRYGIELNHGALLWTLASVDIRPAENSGNGKEDKIRVTRRRDGSISSWFAYSSVDLAGAGRIRKTLLRGVRQ